MTTPNTTAPATVASTADRDAANAARTATVPSTNVPVQVVGLAGVRQVATGGFTTFALLADGSVWSWGTNGYGQLGIGNANADAFTPVR